MAGLAALLALLYAPTIKGLALQWASSPDASYGAILAVIALVIIWRRRAAFADAARRPSGHRPGLAVLASGAALYLLGLLGADVFATRVSLVVVVTGAIWFIAGGRATRVVAPALAFLLMAVPLPALVVNAITLPLQLVASRIAEGLLMAAQVPVFRDGNVLDLRSTSLEVAEACSGLRSLISLGAIACLVAWATESRFLRRAAVVAASVPIAIVLNGVRVAATGLACEVWGPRVARGGWHEFTGWVTFVVAVFVLVQFQRALPRARTRDAALAPEMVSA